MSKTLLIFKIQFINTFSLNKFKKGGNKKEKLESIAAIGGFTLVFILIVLQMFGYSFIMADYLKKRNMLPMMLAMGLILGFLFNLFFSIYNAGNYIFNFKDFDLLMSLPFKESEVLKGKLAFLYITNLLLTFAIVFPYIVVYGLRANISTSYYPMAIFMLLFIPLVPISIGAVFALINGYIASKFKRNNLVMTILSLLLIGILLALMMSINFIPINKIDIIFDDIALVKDKVYLVSVFLYALLDNNIFDALIFALLSLLIYSIFAFIFSNSFKEINLALREKIAAKSYSLKNIRKGSLWKSLYLKEIKAYLSSTIYVTNTGISALFLILIAIFVSFFTDVLNSRGKGIPSYFPISIVVAIVYIFSICLSPTTAASISIEGNSFWIIKTLPIKAWDVFKGKILVSLSINVPAIFISAFILIIGGKVSLIEIGLLVILALLTSIFAAMTGLAMNLNFHKFNWKSVTEIVKQGISVFYTMVATLVLVALTIGILVLTIKFGAIRFLLIEIALIFIIDLIVYRYLRVVGEKKYERIEY